VTGSLPAAVIFFPGPVKESYYGNYPAIGLQIFYE
jgi:hypothetical protein